MDNPPPRSRREYIDDHRLLRKLVLGRLVISAHVEIRNRRVIVPDPTERLVGMIRDFVHGNGARLLVGLQASDPRLEAYLAQERIPFVQLDGKDIYDQSRHWTPQGHVFVAGRYGAFLSEQGVASRGAAVLDGSRN